MAKKKKTPKKNNKKTPDELAPSEVKTAEEHGPKKSPGNGASEVREGAVKKPTETPPAEAAEAEAAFTTGTWERDKRVSALYTTHHSCNAWMYITGKGWVKQATSYESSCEAMNILATHAKLKGSRIDYHVDGGKVTQMYIW